MGIIGVESREALCKSLSNRLSQCSATKGCSLDHWRIDSLKRHIMFMAITLLVLSTLWGVSEKLDNATNGAIL